jgi:heme exporter protein CcmD
MFHFTLGVWVYLAAGLAWADGPTKDYQPYVPPEGGGDTSSLFVVLAYAAIWLVLLLFVGSVWQRQRRVEAELRSLRQRLGSVEK